jgi:uncharacterized protein YbjT (DUF2867 family)
MKVLLFGSTGMVGQGALRECLTDARVREVVSIVRRPTGRHHPRMREVVHDDFMDFSSLHLDVDACLWCLGVTSAGMTETEYTRITHDYTIAAARALDPRVTFVFISGQGADRDFMWARVKKRTEDDLMAMPFAAVYVFRPGFIQPLDGIKSRTRLYNVLYPLLYPVMLALRVLAPHTITDTRRIGRAMLNVARHGHPVRVLDNAAINAAAGEPLRSTGDDSQEDG